MALDRATRRGLDLLRRRVLLGDDPGVLLNPVGEQEHLVRVEPLGLRTVDPAQEQVEAVL
jgi:hypothetical protein